MRNPYEEQDAYYDRAAAGRATLRELRQAVRAHALAHYEEGAWSYITETEIGEDGNLNEMIGKARTATGAIRNVKKRLGPLEDQVANARYEVEAGGGRW